MNRIKWWPIGHHHLLADKPLTKDEQMILQQSLDLAEIEADMAYDKFLEAFEADEHHGNTRPAQILRRPWRGSGSLSQITHLTSSTGTSR